MCYIQNKKLLTDAQLITCNRWEKEREDRKAILDLIQKEGSSSFLIDKLSKTDASMCEHERSSLGECSECSIIYNILLGIKEDD